MTLTALLVIYAFGTGAMAAAAEGPHLHWAFRGAVFTQFFAVFAFLLLSDFDLAAGGLFLFGPTLLAGHFLAGGLAWRGSPALEGRSYLSRSWRAWHDGAALRRRHRDLTRNAPTGA